jgi:tetratricopeptide (TPR) repeat protein
MRLHKYLLFRFFLLLPLLLWSAGCGREPTPEEKQANATFKNAKEAFAQGRHAEGRQLLLAALSLDTQLERDRQMAEETELLGNSYFSSADFDSALFYYNQSVENYRSSSDRSSARAMRLAVAWTYRWMGEERKAFTLYTEALRLANVFEEQQGARDIQWAMLPICRALGKIEDERRILADLVSSYTATADIGNQAKVYYESGLSNLYRDEHEKAIENFLRALTFADQARDSLLAISVVLKLALAYNQVGRSTESFQMYTEGLRRSDITTGARRLREEMLIRVGNIYLGNGQPGEARRFYQAALSSAIKTRNQIAEGYMFIHLGHCEVENRASRNDAIKNYQSAFELFKGLDYPAGRAYVFMSLGLAAKRSKNWNEALDYFRQAVEQDERTLWQRNSDDLYVECEEVFYQLNHTSVYDGIIELLLQLGRYEEAFWYMERKNSRNAFQVLGAFELQARSGDLNRALEKLTHQRDLHIGAERQLASLFMDSPEEEFLIAEVQARLNQTGKLIEEIGNEIVLLDKNYELAVKIANLGLSEVQKLLPSGVVLVEHFAARRSLYMFAITHTSASVKVAAIEKDHVESLIKEYNELLQRRTRPLPADSLRLTSIDHRIAELSVSLYAAFIRPVELSIRDAIELIAISQKEMSSLPLHTLRRRFSRFNNPYLIERYPVSYLPSANALALDNVSMPAGHDIVALGHPGTTSWDVEYELRDIRAFFKDARLHFNQEATLGTLQKERGDVLHLAADFQFDERRPGNSYLMLSDGKFINTTEEVQWGNLLSIPPFPTVIVSDLQDHRSEISGATPFIFLMNSSSSVILNAYPPLRKTKKFFGEIFYTSLLAGRTPQAAFRQSQLDMINNPEYSSPYHWAPFFLWGK